MTPTTYGRDFAYCLKSHGGVRGFYASLWRFLLRCTLFCHSVATFLTSVSSYEGGCGFEVILMCLVVIVNAVEDVDNMLCYHYHLFKFTTNFLSLVERVEINQSTQR